MVLISGDRHIGEISKMTVPGVSYPIYEITSSGLTHPAVQNTGEPNDLRIGPLINQKHYGVLRFRQRGNKLVAEAALQGEQGQPLVSETFKIKR